MVYSIDPLCDSIHGLQEERAADQEPLAPECLKNLFIQSERIWK